MRSEPADGWRRLTVRELVSAAVLIVSDGYRAKNAELGEEGLPFVRAGNLHDRFALEEADILSSASVQCAGHKVARPGDVVFTSKGTVGRFAFVSDRTPAFVYSPQLCFWRVKRAEQMHPRFLYYWMRGPECWQQLVALKGQTDMADFVSLRDQLTMRVSLPPLEEQCRIASVLGALDDKIESNRRLATTLEEIATTLFRAHFVDFVGVEDFQPSEIGQIPRGWTVASVGDILRVVGGGTPSTKEPHYWEGGTQCWATPKDLAGATSCVLLDTARHITDEGVRRISSGLLPRRTVLLSSRAPVGYTAISMVDIAVNQGFIAIPPTGRLPSEYVLCWLRQNMDLIKAHAGGTTFAEISKRAFRPLPMLVPSQEALAEFRQVAAPAVDLIASAEQETHALSRIRDTLLPKLVSGGIRVRTPTIRPR